MWVCGCARSSASAGARAPPVCPCPPLPQGEGSTQALLIALWLAGSGRKHGAQSGVLEHGGPDELHAAHGAARERVGDAAACRATPGECAHARAAFVGAFGGALGGQRWRRRRRRQEHGSVQQSSSSFCVRGWFTGPVPFPITLAPCLHKVDAFQAHKRACTRVHARTHAHTSRLHAPARLGPHPASHSTPPCPSSCRPITPRAPRAPHRWTACSAA